ncbi:MAG: NACHT domain-containing NTPase [Crocosphaera sp.]
MAISRHHPPLDGKSINISAKFMTSRSLSANSQGIEEAKKVLASRGWTQEYLASEVGLSSRQSVWKFLSGRPVSRQIFKELCFTLNLDWKAVVDLPGNQGSSVSSFKLKPSSSDVPQLVSVMRSQVKETIENQCSTLVSPFQVTQPLLEKIYTKTRFSLELSDQRWLDPSDLEDSLKMTQGFRLSSLNSNTIVDLDGLEQQQKLVILGKPGAGKTTFLQYIALQCNQGKYRRNYIPCFIQLRTEWVQEDEEPFDLLNYMITYGKNYGLSQQQVVILLEKGKFLCLLDGLDEVPLKIREGLCKNIQWFAKKYYQNLLIITSRSSAQQFHFRGFTYVEMADFDKKSIELFAQKWFRATSKNKRTGEEKAKDFLEQINAPKNQAIRELAVTPILLNLLCSVFQQKAQFPRQPAKLYQVGLDILLQRWDRSKGIERDDFYYNLSIVDKRKLLSKIAAETFSQERYFFDSREVQEIIEDYLCTDCDFQEDKETLWLTTESVLKSIEIQHGILVERAKGVYSFSHLTFQEYFTARHIIANQGNDLEINLEELVTKMLNQSWRDVILLTINLLPNADVFLQKMKQFIDALSQGNQKLQTCLKCLNEKVKNLTLSSHQTAARAFYFTLLNNRDFNLALSLDNQFAYHSKLSAEIQLDSILARAFLDSLTIVKNPDFKSFLNLCFTLEFKNKDPKESQFFHELSQLKRQLPCPEQEESYIINWWKTQGKEWVEQFRNLLIKYRQIGYDWQLNDQERNLWNSYYQGNVFLVECLQSEGNISKQIKKEITESLLLPPKK